MAAEWINSSRIDCFWTFEEIKQYTEQHTEGKSSQTQSVEIHNLEADGAGGEGWVENAPSVNAPEA